MESTSIEMESTSVEMKKHLPEIVFDVSKLPKQLSKPSTKKS